MSARQDAQARALERRIREIVDTASELTPQQLDGLALLLRPAVRAVAAQRTRGAA